MWLWSVFTRYITIILLVLQSVYPWSEWNSECVTEACEHFAQLIIYAINPDVKPCDNFYQFACGNVMKGILIDRRISLLEGMEHKINEQTISVLQEKPNYREPRMFRSIKRYFQICLDEKKMEDRGVAPGVAMLEKLGGWPVLGNWNPANWNIWECAVNAWHLGLDGYNVIKIEINSDPTHKSKHNFEVDQPDMLIPRDYFIQGEDDSVVKEYFQYMVDMAVLFGADKRSAKEAMNKVLKLQIDIAKTLVPEEQQLQQEPKELTIKELEQVSNKVLNWRKLFEGIVAPMKLQDDHKIVFNELEVIQKILQLINGYSAETVANYVVWNFAIKMSPYLTAAMRDRSDKFLQLAPWYSGRQPRPLECLKEVKKFELALSAMYINKFFDKSSRNKAKDLVDRIQKEMDNAIMEADWMDEATRKKAQLKSAKIFHVVGYPDELADKAKVEEFYKELKLNTELFFEARMDLNSFVFKNMVNKLKEVKTPWKMYSKVNVANAYYVRQRNAILLTAGILQEPFFHASYPKYVNYASIGFTIGHEMTHAFDDEGKEYDDEGLLKDWWDEASLNKFNEKKQCLIDQYSGFVERLTQQKVDGDKTQGEDIADNGGLKLAFRAYRKVARQLNKPEPGLPGLKQYSNDQLFFISFAISWCEVMPYKTMLLDMYYNYYAPAESRINGMVMNSPQFAEVFKCGKGTPMNPTEKCEVW